MRRFAPAVLSVGLLALAACGGDSASSETSNPALGAPSPTSGVAVTDVGPTSSVGVTAAGETPAPTDLLVDSSYDIEAIDGPVVLWFWAPG